MRPETERPTETPSPSVGGRNVRYKYQRLRERLRDAIRSGDLTGKLPGERELARRYDANAKTVNKALSDLTTEGLLVRHVGRGTFVSGGQPAHTAVRSRPLTLAWIGAAPGVINGVARAAQQADELFAAKGHRLQRVQTPHDGPPDLPEGTLGPADLRELDGVILFSMRPSIGFLADLHRCHMPLVMANNTSERVRTYSVLPDYGQGAFELCEHLVRLGHREIMLLIAPRLLPGARSAEQGYAAAMQRHGLRVRPVSLVDTSFDWSTLLANGSRPTGVICIGGRLALEASRRALDAGLTTPSLLSVAAMPEPGELDLTQASITAYEVPLTSIVEWAVELALSAAPGETPETVIVPGALHDRGSAAPRADAAGSDIPPPSQDAVV